MSRTRRGSRIPALTALITLALAACTSATDRLEQGIEFETAGNFEAAAYRYIDALDRDETLNEARERLMEVGDSAVIYSLQDSDEWTARRGYVEATRGILRVDNLLAAARGVGVRLPIPSDYTQRRRTVFDNAVEAHLENGDAALDGGRYGDAVEQYRMARTSSYEAVAEQRDRSLAGESWARVFWARQELDAGRLQGSFNQAGQVLDLSWSPPEASQEAREIMDEALAAGQVEVMMLPVVVSSRRASPALLDLEVRANIALNQGPFSSPPPFIILTNDGAVRTVVREAAALGAGMSPAALSLLLRLVEAEYAAFAEVVTVDATEYDVRQRTRNVRTRDGAPASYVLEQGDRRLRAQVRVVVVNRNGDVVADNTVIGTGVGQFERGVYDGNPANLNLDRREVDHFDPLIIEAQEQEIREALAASIASQLGNAVFDPILARIP